MSWGPIRPARIDFSDPAAPAAPDFGDLYHSRGGAWGQARHVFLGGNGLPARWGGRDRFVILETGFGLGNNFLATWAAWRADPRRPARLWYLAVEKHPPQRADLARALATAPEPALAAALVAHWPPLTPDLHPIDFDCGGVRLLLALGDIRQVLPELVAAVDAFYLDGFAPVRNPAMWDARLLRGLHRLAAPDATLATWCVASAVRNALASAGFAVEKAPGFAGKREMTVARFAPRAAARPAPGRSPQPVREVAVVGAGLAGAAAARALAERGLAVQVFDRRTAPAAETSGQAGGLLHGVVHADDAAHSRWLRAAALFAARDLAPRIACGRVTGALPGLWRGEHRLTLGAMQAIVERLGLPCDYVQPDCLSGGGAAWLFTGGGWASAPTLVAHWLAADGIALRLGAAVRRLERHGDRGWILSGDGEAVLAQVDAVVLANACDLPRLWSEVHWPLQAGRGQTTVLPAATPGLPRLPRPIADAGYALQLADGRLLCGVTGCALDGLAQADALNRSGIDPLSADHTHNLDTLARLTGWRARVDEHSLDGRVGARVLCADRLPLVGPLPAADTGTARLDQPRWVPREPGLLVLGALGSRGLAQAALAGEVLASWLAGAPIPVPASLIDAIDPARFVSRAARASASKLARPQPEAQG